MNDQPITTTTEALHGLKIAAFVIGGLLIFAAFMDARNRLK